MTDFIFDIDGTLADNTHRLHHITGPGPKNWDAFLDPETVIKDRPILPVWFVLDALILHANRIIFITSRSRGLRNITQQWLSGRGRTAFYTGFSHENINLYMRRSSDRRPSHEVKRELLAKVRLDGFNPVMAFDDRLSDAEMFRSEGLTCALLSEGKF